MKWSYRTEQIQAGITKYWLLEADHTLSYQQWIEQLSTSCKDFANFFSEILAQSPYTAFFWEVKPIGQQDLHQAFEFVLVDSSTLLRLVPDYTPFVQYFPQKNDLTARPVVSFKNLGKDAHLIVPLPFSDTANYAHLSAFLRTAPPTQIGELWSEVAKVYSQVLQKQAYTWLSTAGLGVSWLHIRVDSRPKYYRYLAYKQYQAES
jgi:hypothetical protein